MYKTVCRGFETLKVYFKISAKRPTWIVHQVLHNDTVSQKKTTTSSLAFHQLGNLHSLKRYMNFFLHTSYLLSKDFSQICWNSVKRFVLQDRHVIWINILWCSGFFCLRRRVGKEYWVLQFGETRRPDSWLDTYRESAQGSYSANMFNSPYSLMRLSRVHWAHSDCSWLCCHPVYRDCKDVCLAFQMSEQNNEHFIMFLPIVNNFCEDRSICLLLSFLCLQFKHGLSFLTFVSILSDAGFHHSVSKVWCDWTLMTLARWLF